MTTEREDIDDFLLSAEREELGVRELSVRRAGATIGKILIDRWHLPPDAVDGFLQDTYQRWGLFWRSMPRPENWVRRQIVKRARAYMDSRGIAPAADGPDGSPYTDDEPPHILDVIRTQEAIATLPPNVARAFALWLEGRSREQIAKKLNVTPAYVRKLVNVAVNRLRAWRPRREK